MSIFSLSPPFIKLAAYRVRRPRNKLAAYFFGVLIGNEMSLPRFIFSIRDLSITDLCNIIYV